MKLGIIQMKREEYSDGKVAIRDYKIFLLGIPVYIAKFTSTNREAVKLLAVEKRNQVSVKGFNKQ